VAPKQEQSMAHITSETRQTVTHSVDTKHIEDTKSLELQKLQAEVQRRSLERKEEQRKREEERQRKWQEELRQQEEQHKLRLSMERKQKEEEQHKAELERQTREAERARTSLERKKQQERKVDNSLEYKTLDRQLPPKPQTITETLQVQSIAPPPTNTPHWDINPALSTIPMQVTTSSTKPSAVVVATKQVQSPSEIALVNSPYFTPSEDYLTWIQNQKLQFQELDSLSLSLVGSNNSSGVARKVTVNMSSISIEELKKLQQDAYLKKRLELKAATKGNDWQLLLQEVDQIFHQKLQAKIGNNKS
jgi:hypothetical protein